MHFFFPELVYLRGNDEKKERHNADVKQGCEVFLKAISIECVIYKV